MNIEKIDQKIKDLEYRINMDNIGLEKAEYNVVFYKRLGIDEEQLKSYLDTYDYYFNKLHTDKCTYNSFTSYRAEYGKNLQHAGNLFKCTLPYEKADTYANYQTTITVDGTIAGLFANGINSNDVVECLDNSDIKNIESKFKMSIPNDFTNEVGVEYIDESEAKQLFDEPILVKNKNNQYRGLIASSAIPSCFSFNSGEYKDLNGNNFTPGLPTFDSIIKLKEQVANKQEKFDTLHSIETKVKCKIEDSISKMDDAIINHGLEGSITNVLKGGV